MGALRTRGLPAPLRGPPFAECGAGRPRPAGSPCPSLPAGRPRLLCTYLGQPSRPGRPGGLLRPWVRSGPGPCAAGPEPRAHTRARAARRSGLGGSVPLAAGAPPAGGRAASRPSQVSSSSAATLPLPPPPPSSFSLSPPPLSPPLSLSLSLSLSGRLSRRPCRAGWTRPRRSGRHGGSREARRAAQPPALDTAIGPAGPARRAATPPSRPRYPGRHGKRMAHDTIRV